MIEVLGVKIEKQKWIDIEILLWDVNYAKDLQKQEDAYHKVNKEFPINW